MQIVFNDKTYNSLEEMPAKERQAYEQMQKIFVDANGNGIPDFLEVDIVKNVITAFASTINYDGKVYGNFDELPPEARQKMQDAFAKLNQLGITGVNPLAQKEQAFEPAFQPSKPLIPQSPTIREGSGMRWMLLVGFMAAALVCVVAAALAFFMFMR